MTPEEHMQKAEEQLDRVETRPNLPPWEKDRLIRLAEAHLTAARARRIISEDEEEDGGPEAGRSLRPFLPALQKEN